MRAEITNKIISEAALDWNLALASSCSLVTLTVEKFAVS
jgi:hypothetical protein